MTSILLSLMYALCIAGNEAHEQLLRDKTSVVDKAQECGAGIFPNTAPSKQQSKVKNKNNAQIRKERNFVDLLNSVLA